MARPVYLDNAATTPVDPRVLDAMLPHLGGRRGNPSSLHAAGLINASPGEILFTSGGTESDNLAVLGLARAASPRRRHVVVSRVEHAAVRESARRLESEGFEVSWVGVDANGLVDPAEFASALRPDTGLAAVVWANNEVGAVEPIEELAGICAERGVPLHADAVQAAGRLPLDVEVVRVSTLAISGHKLYGPQGVGALYVRGGVPLERVLFGGGQESGLRSGTEDVAGLVGLGEAALLAAEELEERSRHQKRLREAILEGVAEIAGIHINGHRERRLANNAHLSVEGVEAEALVLFLDSLGYAIGSGSACASGSAGHKASPVLLAMGREEREAFSAVRITVGKENTLEEVEGFLEAFSTT